MRKLLIIMGLCCVFFRVNAQENKPDYFQYFKNRKPSYISFSVIHDYKNIPSGLISLLTTKNTWNRTLNNFGFMVHGKATEWFDLGLTVNKYADYNDINVIQTSYHLNSNVPINTLGEKSEESGVFVSFDIQPYIPIPLKKQNAIRFLSKFSIGGFYIAQNNYVFNNDDIVLNERSTTSGLFAEAGLGILIPISYDKIWIRMDLSRVRLLGQPHILEHLQYDVQSQQINYVEKDISESNHRFLVSLVYSPK